jgi:hypothetical protein
MLARKHLERILGDESLTRGLRDTEARMLVEWLVDQAERLEQRARDAQEMDGRVQQLCLRARGFRRFVELWFSSHSRAAACQLYAAQRWEWPLPDCEFDPYEVLQDILTWETEADAEAARAA